MGYISAGLHVVWSHCLLFAMRIYPTVTLHRAPSLPPSLSTFTLRPLLSRHKRRPQMPCPAPRAARTWRLPLRCAELFYTRQGWGMVRQVVNSPPLELEPGLQCPRCHCAVGRERIRLTSQCWFTWDDLHASHIHCCTVQILSQSPYWCHDC